jgi:hypothetical protein
MAVQAKFGQYLQDAKDPMLISQTEKTLEWEQVSSKEQVLPMPVLSHGGFWQGFAIFVSDYPMVLLFILLKSKMLFYEALRWICSQIMQSHLILFTPRLLEFLIFG